VRLSKVMAERGICSRREADEFIERGWVFVDGSGCRSSACASTPDARITLAAEATRTQQQRDDHPAAQAGRLRLRPARAGLRAGGQPDRPDNQFDRDTPALPSQPAQEPGAGRPAGHRLHRPAGADPGRPRRPPADRRGFGRSTRNTSSASRARWPRTAWRCSTTACGWTTVRCKPAKVEWINDDQLRFVLREGRKRQIRRMCELVGLQVVGLKRVRIGQVKLGDLPLGQWRFLRRATARASSAGDSVTLLESFSGCVAKDNSSGARRIRPVAALRRHRRANCALLAADRAPGRPRQPIGPPVGADPHRLFAKPGARFRRI
jgi:23S rRNA pseudouridine2604 synthase